LADEVAAAFPECREYLSGFFSELLAMREIRAIISAQLAPDISSQQRLGLVFERMGRLAAKRK
jgi:hypothetical protein